MGKRSRNPSFSNTVNNPRGRRSRTASEGDNQAKPSQPGYMGRHSTGAGGGKHGEICLHIATTCFFTKLVKLWM